PEASARFGEIRAPLQDRLGLGGWNFVLPTQGATGDLLGGRLAVAVAGRRQGEPVVPALLAQFQRDGKPALALDLGHASIFAAAGIEFADILEVDGAGSTRDRIDVGAIL